MAPGEAPTGQKSILGFFRRGQASSQAKSSSTPKLNGTTSLPIGSLKKQLVKGASSKPLQTLTPAPSSDAVVEEEDEDVVKPSKAKNKVVTGLPSPVTPMGLDGSIDAETLCALTNSPSRKVWMPLLHPRELLTSAQAKKKVNYAESGSDDSDQENNNPTKKTRRRLLKRRKTEDEEEAYGEEQNGDDGDEVDEGKPQGSVQSYWTCLK